MAVQTAVWAFMHLLQKRFEYVALQRKLMLGKNAAANGLAPAPTPHVELAPLMRGAWIVSYLCLYCIELPLAPLHHAALGPTASDCPWLHCIRLLLPPLHQTALGSTASDCPWLHCIRLLLAPLHQTALGSTASGCPWLHCIRLALASLHQTGLGCTAPSYSLITAALDLHWHLIAVCDVLSFMLA